MELSMILDGDLDVEEVPGEVLAVGVAAAGGKVASRAAARQAISAAAAELLHVDSLLAD